MHINAQAVRDALNARMFKGNLVENRWRGDLVEEIVRMALEPRGWLHCSADWKSWDFEHAGRKLKMQVKQTARRQTWGISPAANRFGIGPAKGFYEGSAWKQLLLPQRLAEVYVFAHHPREDDTADHWDATQWYFSVAKESELPHAKSMSVRYLTETWKPVGIMDLDREVDRACALLAPNGRTEAANVVVRGGVDDGEAEGEAN